MTSDDLMLAAWRARDLRLLFERVRFDAKYGTLLRCTNRDCSARSLGSGWNGLCCPICRALVRPTPYAWPQHTITTNAEQRTIVSAVGAGVHEAHEQHARLLLTIGSGAPL